MAIKITAGNVDDRKPLKAMVKDLKGKVFGDKGYISKTLFQDLWRKGVQLITGIRKNMKNYLLPIMDKLLLRKRFVTAQVVGGVFRLRQIDSGEHIPVF